MKYGPTIICSISGRRVKTIHSAEWNSDTCARCLPPNDNPELARLVRMKANDAAKAERN